MNCANHPDVAALGVCRECGRPLCSLCVYFREGHIVCREHAAPGAVEVGVAADAAEAEAAPTAPVAGEIGGGLLPRPALDARLEPLPMSLRPGWPDEPAQPRPSTLGENMGLIGLVLGIAALPFSICCGVGGYVGAPLALIGGGLCIAALVTAARTRNPAQARWTGGIGLGVNVLSLAISMCYVVAITAMTASFNSSFSSLLTATP